MENSPTCRLPNMLMNQRRDIEDSGNYGKMSWFDLKRIDMNLIGDIFGDECVEWRGERKNEYGTVSFKSVKVSIRRLVYHNFIGNVENVKMETSCNNKLCCSIKHFTEY